MYTIIKLLVGLASGSFNIKQILHQYLRILLRIEYLKLNKMLFLYL